MEPIVVVPQPRLKRHSEVSFCIAKSPITSGNRISNGVYLNTCPVAMQKNVISQVVSFWEILVVVDQFA